MNPYSEMLGGTSYEDHTLYPTTIDAGLEDDSDLELEDISLNRIKQRSQQEIKQENQRVKAEEAERIISEARTSKEKNRNITSIKSKLMNETRSEEARKPEGKHFKAVGLQVRAAKQLNINVRNHKDLSHPVIRQGYLSEIAVLRQILVDHMRTFNQKIAKYYRETGIQSEQQQGFKLRWEAGNVLLHQHLDLLHTLDTFIERKAPISEESGSPATVVYDPEEGFLQ